MKDVVQVFGNEEEGICFWGCYTQCHHRLAGLKHHITDGHFPGGPVVKTELTVLQAQSQSRNEDPHATKLVKIGKAGGTDPPKSWSQKSKIISVAEIRASAGFAPSRGSRENLISSLAASEGSRCLVDGPHPPSLCPAFTRHFLLFLFVSNLPAPLP